MAKKLLLAFLIILGASLIAFLAWFCFQYFAKQQASVPAYFSSLTVGEEATFDTDKSAKSAEVFSSSLTENFALLKTKEAPSRSSSSASSPLLPPSLPLEVLAPPPSLMDIDKGDYLPRIAADGTEPYNFYKAPFDYKKYAREAKLAIVVTGLGLAKSTTNIAPKMFFVRQDGCANILIRTDLAARSPFLTSGTALTIRMPQTAYGISRK